MRANFTRVLGSPAPRPPQKAWVVASVFLLFMAVFIGMAGWFVYWHERDEEAVTGGEVPVLSGQDVSRMASREAPVFKDVDAPHANVSFKMSDALPDEASQPVDGDHVAEAMDAVRAGNEYLFAKNWEQAERYARKALAIWPEMTMARRLMGVVYIQEGPVRSGHRHTGKGDRSGPV